MAPPQQPTEQPQLNKQQTVTEQPTGNTMDINGPPQRLRGGDGHHPIAECCCVLCICCGLEELCCLEAIDGCLGACC